MKNRKLIENSYSPVRVRTVLGSRGRMLYHAADVCDVLGLATEALEQVEPIEIKANGELIAVLDMQAVTQLTSRSPPAVCARCTGLDAGFGVRAA